jgi:hypothetical protein
VEVWDKTVMRMQFCQGPIRFPKLPYMMPKNLFSSENYEEMYNLPYAGRIMDPLEVNDATNIISFSMMEIKVIKMIGFSHLRQSI